MTTMNISLPAPLKEWVTAQQASGRYTNASDYVEDLIRRDQEYAARTKELQAMVTDSLASGISDLTVEDILENVIKRQNEA
jgi:antitoxin ParD1/3/4